jgi:hypothetical protein
MVRRRSTVRFRKGAPGHRTFFAVGTGGHSPAWGTLGTNRRVRRCIRDGRRSVLRAMLGSLSIRAELRSLHWLRTTWDPRSTRAPGSDECCGQHLAQLRLSFTRRTERPVTESPPAGAYIGGAGQCQSHAGSRDDECLRPRTSRPGAGGTGAAVNVSDEHGSPDHPIPARSPAALSDVINALPRSGPRSRADSRIASLGPPARRSPSAASPSSHRHGSTAGPFEGPAVLPHVGAPNCSSDTLHGQGWRRLR